MVFSIPLRPTLLRFLPTPFYNQIRHAIYGWEFRDKSEDRPKVDPIFLYVTPGQIEFWVQDVEIANAILTRRNDFVQSDIGSRIMGLFGRNVITEDGSEWSRHRKLIAPALNEKISDLVWKESCQQAKEMLDHFVDNDAGQTDQSIAGLRTIAINVLGAAGYGISTRWKEQTQTVQAGHSLTYIDTLHSVMNDFLWAIVLPAKWLTLPIMPSFLRKLGTAMHEFPLYTKEMLQRERNLQASTSGTASNNFMSTLVKASDDEKKQHQKSSTGSKAPSQSLSEDEIRGNLYQFSIAGFDTTANTMAYAVTQLAAKPEWQDWISEEISQVYLAASSSPFPAYEATFPRLLRTQALLYETLRLYTPVAHISRQLAVAQSFTTASGETFQVHGGSLVYVNVDGIMADTEIWGPDALTFRPSRWLTTNSAGAVELIQPPKGTFLPWSGGPRVCPGMKMAQVEFVAVLATVFRYGRVESLVGKERLEELMVDSQPRITLQMNRPEEVKLRWVAKT